MQFYDVENDKVYGLTEDVEPEVDSLEILNEADAPKSLISLTDFMIKRPATLELNRVAVKNNLNNRLAKATTKAQVEKVIAIAEKNIKGINKLRDNKINTGNIVPGLDAHLKTKIIDKTLANMETIITDCKTKLKTLKD